MQRWKKKGIIGALAGAVFLAGTFGVLHVQAESNAQADRGWGIGQGRRHMNADDMARFMNDRYGVSEADVKSALDSGCGWRDIRYGCMLSEVTGKSLSDILSYKTDKNTWRDVSNQLGVTRDSIRATRQKHVAERMSQSGDIDQATAEKLLSDRYQPFDIMAAARLAKAAGTDVQSVLDRKKINNTWRDVADELHVDQKALRPGDGYGCWGPGPGPMMGDWDGPADRSDDDLPF